MPKGKSTKKAAVVEETTDVEEFDIDELDEDLEDADVEDEDETDEDDEEEGDDLEEIEEDEEPAKPAKGKGKGKTAKSDTARAPKRPAIEFGSSELAAHVSEKTGKTIDPRNLRILLRKMAADGEILVGREGRERYSWAGPTDPDVKAVLKAVKGGALEKEKNAGLEKARAAKQAKKDAAEAAAKAEAEEAAKASKGKKTKATAEKAPAKGKSKAKK